MYNQSSLQLNCIKNWNVIHVTSLIPAYSFSNYHNCDKKMMMFLSCSVGTFCGVFRRQALDRGAILMKVDRIVTGK